MSFMEKDQVQKKRQYFDFLSTNNLTNLLEPLSQFQARAKIRNKAQKRVKKKIELKLLVLMMNKSNKTYDRPISIR